MLQPDVDRKPNRQGLPNCKNLFTDRHKKLCELLKMERKAAGLTQTALRTTPTPATNQRLAIQ
jgi:hypothetical protein